MSDVMKVTQADLARLSFSAKDVLNEKAKRFAGEELREGEEVQITVTARVTRTPSGNLIFGEFGGDAWRDFGNAAHG